MLKILTSTELTRYEYLKKVNGPNSFKAIEGLKILTIFTWLQVFFSLQTLMTLLHNKLANRSTKISYKQAIDILLLGFAVFTAFAFARLSGGK
jgi:hypothetical protein